MRLVAKQMEPDAIGLECKVSSKACLAVVDMEGLLAYHSRPAKRGNGRNHCERVRSEDAEEIWGLSR